MTPGGPPDQFISTAVLYRANAVLTTPIRLRFDGRSTAYHKSQGQQGHGHVTLTYRQYNFRLDF